MRRPILKSVLQPFWHRSSFEMKKARYQSESYNHDAEWLPSHDGFSRFPDWDMPEDAHTNTVVYIAI
jgi:hypothetical protein